MSLVPVKTVHTSSIADAKTLDSILFVQDLKYFGLTGGSNGI